MKKFFLIAIAAFALYSCGNKSKNADNQIQGVSQAVIDEHTAENSLDFEGEYVGVLPAADAEGIEIKITLDGGSYTIFTQFLGKDDEGTTQKGTYSWNESGDVITLEGLDKPNQYFVGENTLFALDTNGNKIEGNLADKYILNKQLGSDNE